MTHGSPADAYNLVKKAADYIKETLPTTLYPNLGIVCGSGLSGLVEELEAPICYYEYQNIPGFVTSTVQGHAGKLAFGILGGKPTVLMLGRLHHYEGHTVTETAFPIRVMKLLGVESLIVTNASGSINPTYNVGDLCLLLDHISIPSLSGNNPLRGPNVEQFGPRFPPMSIAYPFELRQKAVQACKDVNFDISCVHEGVYAFVGGPSYETPAELRALRSLGCDVVGMSTVPEIITASHCGLKVLAMALVTNKVVIRSAVRVLPIEGEQLCQDDGPPPASHEEVLATSKARASDMKKIVRRIAQLL